MKTCDAFISGGGSLLQDVTSLRNIVYYTGLIRMAGVAKKPAMIYAQGIGPLKKPLSQKLTRIGLDRVPVGRPAWLDLPSHYLLTTHDAAVPPALQREMAARMGAVVTGIDSSHAPMLVRPRDVAVFLDTACAALAG